MEVLALMIASLSHDLDHRGVNNTYIERYNTLLQSTSLLVFKSFPATVFDRFDGTKNIFFYMKTQYISCL